MSSGERQPTMWHWGPQVWSYVDVAIRVPPLFVMDSLLAKGFIPTGEWDQVIDEPRLGTLPWFLAYSSMFLLSFFAFILETRHLLKAYILLSSLGVLLWSHIWNEEFVRTAISFSERNSNIIHECLELNTQVILKVLGNYMLQIFFGIIFSFSVYPRAPSPSLLFSLWIIFISPTFLTLFSSLLPSIFLTWSPFVSTFAAHMLLIFELIMNAKSAIHYVQYIIEKSKAIFTNEGVFVILKSQWQRLHVPQVLRLFWISRILEHASVLLSEAHSSNVILNWVQLSKILLVRGCETTVSLMGMTSLVSVVSHHIAVAMKAFLQMDDADERNMGTVSAILFFVLAMQSGLTSMDPEKRIYRLYQNVCLLITAILHFFHSMLNSLLQMLGASLNSPREKHIRALLVCAFLIVFPVAFMYVVWTRHNLSTWLLALSCFSTEVVMKVIVSLVMYVLFMIDARLDSSWEPFDDYLYMARAVGSFLEIIFGMFLLLNGAWIFFFEQSGSIRAFTILFHAYFNVWTQAKQGWANSVRRREAGRRLAEFRRATQEQLSRLNDVCAICHHEMEAAIVTDCEHFYHVNCLRRWLFMQNHCPLCHSEFGSENRGRERGGDNQVEDEDIFVRPLVIGELHAHAD